MFKLEKTSLFTLEEVRLYRLSGPDAQSYLHARSTQDIASLKPGQGAFGLLLSPQGKIHGDFIVIKEMEFLLLITTTPETGESDDSFAKTLLQFKVSEQLELKNISSKFSFFSIQGPGSRKLLEKLSPWPSDKENLLTHKRGHIAQPKLDQPSQQECTLIFHPRGTREGFDIMLPASQSAGLFDTLAPLTEGGLHQGTSEELKILRICAGLPKTGHELSKQTSAVDIPYDKYIAPSKGCYPGQEVIEKVKNIGRTNQRLVIFASPGPKLEEGSCIFESSAPTKVVGKITSSCVIPESNECFCLGFLKSKVQIDSSLIVSGQMLRAVEDN